MRVCRLLLSALLTASRRAVGGDDGMPVRPQGASANVVRDTINTNTCLSLNHFYMFIMFPRSKICKANYKMDTIDTHATTDMYKQLVVA